MLHICGEPMEAKASGLNPAIPFVFICFSRQTLFNKTLDETFSVSIINNKGEMVSSYNAILRNTLEANKSKR